VIIKNHSPRSLVIYMIILTEIKFDIEVISNLSYRFVIRKRG